MTAQTACPLIGRPSRAEDLDVLPGFRDPPPGYGEVAFYWWVGDALTKDRLAWQLQQLSAVTAKPPGPDSRPRPNLISGLQINYAHGDTGGQSWGLTYESEPKLFSEEWWSLFGWFKDEAQRHGMAVSLSDYTLGIGQGWLIDDALRANPRITARVLHSGTRAVAAGEAVDQDLPDSTLSLWWISADESVDLTASLTGGRIHWHPSRAGRLVWVWHELRSPSIDPTHPDSGAAVCRSFFGEFERRFPGECGGALNFFFSDELDLRVGGRGSRVWSELLGQEFQRLKGYDVRPLLAALFVDLGPRTVKVRLDYNDVYVSLAEAHYFKPVFDWHESRGMIYGCDHGGRGRDVMEFGDYFRTQRWNQGVGCDQPRLECDLIKNKVAASIAHLSGRPRVWLEGFYSSGWGTSTEQVWNAIAANFLHGHNLLTLHGLYYTTHGGWWEWAPPCNHFRMPYWRHMGALLAASERLSYLLSQGTHFATVALLYPVASAEADLNAEESVQTAFDFAEALYGSGYDFDFVDFQSLDGARVAQARLHISSERFGVLVLPAMRAIRYSTLVKAAEFAEAGGTVLAIGALPEASDHAGSGDPSVDDLVRRLFHPGGIGVHADSINAAIDHVAARHARAIEVEQRPPPQQFLHRRIGPRQLFALRGLPARATVTLAATGVPELWDPFSGQSRLLPVVARNDSSIRLQLDNHPDELQLIVVSPADPGAETVVPPADEPGTLLDIELGPTWEIEYVPTLDNTFGDFAWPPSPVLIGPEARSFRHAPAQSLTGDPTRPDFDDSAWVTAHAGYGPQFLRLGPLTKPFDINAESALKPDSTWRPYEFSFTHGLRDDPGHQGYHGLKEETHDAFIALGLLVRGHPATRREPDPHGDVNYLWTTVHAPQGTAATLAVGGLSPSVIYLNGTPALPGDIKLKPGANTLLLRYDGPGYGYAVVLAAGAALPAVRTTVGSLRSPWADVAGLMPFDISPDEAAPGGWYRFSGPPGMLRLAVPATGQIRCWVDGVEFAPSISVGETHFALEAPSRHASAIAIWMRHDRGVYGGNAIPGPIRFTCGEGILPAGDWSAMPGLNYYSGGIRYTSSLSVPHVADGRWILDLGVAVASVEVLLNGKPVGIRVCPPWTFDLTAHLHPGDNRLEILVLSALAAHFRSIPTDYPGTEQRSGLLGPVRLRCLERRTRA